MVNFILFVVINIVLLSLSLSGAISTTTQGLSCLCLLSGYYLGLFSE